MVTSSNVEFYESKIAKGQMATNAATIRPMIAGWVGREKR